MLENQYDISVPAKGDFIVENQHVFEIGGRKKDFKQIQNEETGYIVCDDIEIGIKKRIPLWLFGFLY